MNMIDECKIVEARVFSKNAKVTVQRSGKLGFSAEVELISAKGNLPRCRVNASTSGKIAGYSFTAGKYSTTNSYALVPFFKTSQIRGCVSSGNRDFLWMFEGKSRIIRKRSAVQLVFADRCELFENGEMSMWTTP